MIAIWQLFEELKFKMYIFKYIQYICVPPLQRSHYRSPSFFQIGTNIIYCNTLDKFLGQNNTIVFSPEKVWLLESKWVFLEKYPLHIKKRAAFIILLIFFCTESIDRNKRIAYNTNGVRQMSNVKLQSHPQTALTFILVSIGSALGNSFKFLSVHELLM